MSLRIALRHRAGDFRLDIDVTAPPGTVALFGHSGAGKTSIVNAVAGITQPDEGRIEVGGDVLLDTKAGIDLPVHRRRVGYVFQEGRLFPHMSVETNLAYAARVQRRDPEPREMSRIVDLLGIGDLLSRRPGRLSGGEKQRVAIGRALLSAPRILLMDEPLAALDPARKEEILPYLERLRDEARVPILYVSHTVAEISRLADTIVLLEKGRVLCAGPAPEVMADPAALPAFGTDEMGALLSGRVVAWHAEDGLAEIALSAGTLFVPGRPLAPGRSVRLRVAAGDVILATEAPRGLSALNVLSVTVTGLTDLGEGRVAVGLRAGSDRLLARITRRSAGALGLAPGQPAFAILKSTQLASGG